MYVFFHNARNDRYLPYIACVCHSTWKRKMHTYTITVLLMLIESVASASYVADCSTLDFSDQPPLADREESLHQCLLNRRRYNRLRPAGDGGATTSVTLLSGARGQVTILAIPKSLFRVDEREQSVRMPTWLISAWQDERLRWNASSSGVETLMFEENTIWRPPWMVGYWQGGLLNVMSYVLLML